MTLATRSATARRLSALAGTSRCALRLTVLCVCLCAAVSCGASKKAGGAVGAKAGGVIGVKVARQFSLQVNVAENANQNNAIPVDFVMVFDKKLAAEVLKLPARDWFERRLQLQRDFPGKIVVASWEWVPGQHTGMISMDIGAGFEAGIFFARYLNAGDHRAVVDVRTPVVLNLGAEDFLVQALR
jgi:type VI secretion system protein